MINNEQKGIRLSKRTLALMVVILGGITLLALGAGGGSTEQILGANLLALIPAAFLSGVLSFLSPCSLPILPAYFAYSFQSSKKNIVVMTLAFFAGLATTMTLVGASVTAVSRLLVRNIAEVSIIGGAIIIVFGILSILGKGPTGVQFQESTARTVGGSYIYGATFAIGWTACIGPILGAILTLLATQGAGILQGALLSFVYALGLGMPLILISLFFSRLGNGSRFWKFIRGRMFTVSLFGRELALHTTTLISGVLLMAMGVLLMTGTLNRITQIGLESGLSAWVISIDEQIRVLFG
ncbi:MAG: cytochrome c biogenesis CcdA family protein, partial [Brevefilum sp.]